MFKSTHKGSGKETVIHHNLWISASGESIVLTKNAREMSKDKRTFSGTVVWCIIDVNIVGMSRTDFLTASFTPYYGEVSLKES